MSLEDSNARSAPEATMQLLKRDSMTCRVNGCKLRTKQFYLMHRLPDPEKEPHRFVIWLKAIAFKGNTEDWRTTYICSKHFEEKYFKGMDLSPNAVPTLNLSYMENVLYNEKRATNELSNYLQRRSALMEGQITDGDEPSNIPDCPKKELQRDNILPSGPQCKPQRPILLKCSVKDCGFSTKQTTQLFHFPAQDTERLKQWLSQVALAERTPVKQLRICNRHFTPNSYQDSTYTVLKADALPTLRTGRLKKVRLQSVPPPKRIIEMCFACLATEVRMQRLSKQQLEQYNKLLGIEADNESEKVQVSSEVLERLPPAVCYECLATLTRLDQFKARARQARYTLKDVAKSKTSPTVISKKAMLLCHSTTATLLSLTRFHLSPDDKSERDKRTSLGDRREVRLPAHSGHGRTSEMRKRQQRRSGSTFSSIAFFREKNDTSALLDQSVREINRRLLGLESPLSWCCLDGLSIEAASCEELDLEEPMTLDMDVHVDHCPSHDDKNRAGAYYECETCGDWFTHKSTLARHIDSHRPDEQWGLDQNVCEQCFEAFPTPLALLTHTSHHLLRTSHKYIEIFETTPLKKNTFSTKTTAIHNTTDVKTKKVDLKTKNTPVKTRRAAKSSLTNEKLPSKLKKIPRVELMHENKVEEILHIDMKAAEKEIVHIDLKEERIAEEVKDESFSDIEMLDEESLDDDVVRSRMNPL